MTNDLYAFIQYKNTDICVDIECLCGESFHYDGYFAYYLQCPNCNQIFKLNTHIEIQPENNPPKGYIAHKGFI